MAGNIFDQFDTPPAPVDHEAARAGARAFPAPAKFTDDQLLAAPSPGTLPPPPEPGTLSPGRLPPLPAGATLDPPATARQPQQGGQFTDDQLLSAPGPDPRQLPAGYTVDKVPPLPAGATLDKLPPPPEPGTLSLPSRQRNPFDVFDGQPPATAAQAARLPDGAVLDDGHPNSAGHWAGAIGRGALDGLTGLADLTTTPLVRGVNDLTRAAGFTPSQTMIALGRSGDDQLNRDLDGNHLNLPIAQTAGQRIAGGIAGAVAPTVATLGLGEGLGAVAGAGRAAQAVRGVGQLLSGSKGVQIAGAATGGAANVAGQEAGLSPEDAALLGLGASFVPGAGMAARTAAGNAARGAFVNSIAKTLTPEEAAQTVRAGTMLGGYGGVSSPAAQAAYGADLNAATGSSRRAAQAAGYVDPEDGRAISQAATAANSGATAAGTATAGFRALGLPADHQAALEGAIGQLQAVSALPSGSGAAVGPISSLVARAAPYVAGLSAIGAAHGGDYLHAAELATGAIAGKTIASPALRMVGAVGDRLLGTSMSPAEARLAAAQRIVGQTGMDTSGNPLAALQAATGDAQTQAGLLQNANDQAAAQARGRNLADTAGNWMEKQLILATKKATPGVPITGAASLTARTPQELWEATSGRYGSPTDDPLQSGLMANAQGQVGPAPAPGAPRTAAPSGSPSGVAVGGSQGQPVGMPRGQAQGASGSLQLPSTGMSSIAAPIAPQFGPFDPTAAPSGGVALAGMMHRDMTGFVPTTAQLHQSANAVLDPMTAFNFTSGGTTSRDTAYKVALHAAQSVPDQAASDVSAAMGGSAAPAAQGVPTAPLGGRGPVIDPVRYGAAVGSYQRHAQQMFQLAGTPAAKQAISQIAATPAAADKQAILDVYKANNPGADVSVFTPQLMRGA